MACDGGFVFLYMCEAEAVLFFGQPCAAERSFVVYCAEREERK